MKSTGSIEVPEFQYQINKKLKERQKQKIHLIKCSPTINHHSKLRLPIKWNIIKRQLHKQNENFKMTTPYTKKEDLWDTINRVMLLEKTLIDLSRNVGNYRRLQMLCILFHCSLSIVFNAYNLVVFLLKLVNQTDELPLTLSMLLFFYGYHIQSSALDIIISVAAYCNVFESIRKTASKMDELNIYISDSILNSRISQMSTYVYNNLRTFTLYGLFNIDGSLLTSILSVTTTYIIILMQYSGDGEICRTAVPPNGNKTQQT